MNKKVLHIFGVMNRGGAELRTLALAPSLKQQGIHFDYCALSGKTGVLDDEIEQSGSKVHYCKLSLLFPFAFIRLLKRENYDVVHSHVALSSGFIVFLAWLAGIEVRISHFRSTQAGTNNSLIRRIRDTFLRKSLLFFSTKIVGVCHAALDAFLGKSWNENNRCKVIYNGMMMPSLTSKDDAPEITANAKAIKVISIARMDPPKNHERMIDIMSALIEQYPNSHLYCIGKTYPEKLQSLQTKISSYGLSENIHFLGEKSNIHPYLANANIMLFPSLWEGLPGVVLEAASHGLNVVASPLPGVIEIQQLINGVKTISLDANDREWADALVTLSVKPKDDTDRDIKRFQTSPFHIDKCLNDYQQLYS